MCSKQTKFAQGLAGLSEKGDYNYRHHNRQRFACRYRINRANPVLVMHVKPLQDLLEHATSIERHYGPFGHHFESSY